MRLGWMASRVYIVGLAVLTFTLMLNIEGFLHFVMSVWEWDASSYHKDNFAPLGITPYTHLVAPCDLVMPSLAFMTVVLSFIGGLLNSIYTASTSWGGMDTAGRLKASLDILATPVITTLFWYLVDWEIRSYKY